MEESLITFYDLLQAEVPNPPKNTTKRIYECLVNEGEETTFRTIQRYRRGQVIPTFRIAKIILKVMNINVSDSKLLVILAYSKQKLKEKKEEENKIYVPYVRGNERKQKGQMIEIDFSNIDINAPSNLVKDIIEGRIINLYGELNINRYIEELISYDINNEIIKGDITNEQ